MIRVSLTAPTYLLLTPAEVGRWGGRRGACVWA